MARYMGAGGYSQGSPGPGCLPKWVSKDVPKWVSKDVPKWVSKDVPKWVSKDIPKCVSKDVPKWVSKDVPKWVSKDVLPCMSELCLVQATLSVRTVNSEMVLSLEAAMKYNHTKFEQENQQWRLGTGVTSGKPQFGKNNG